jgi:hypothetical protein
VLENAWVTDRNATSIGERTAGRRGTSATSSQPERVHRYCDTCGECVTCDPDVACWRWNSRTRRREELPSSEHVLVDDDPDGYNLLED